MAVGSMRGERGTEEPSFCLFSPLLAQLVDEGGSWDPQRDAQVLQVGAPHRSTWR